MTYQEYKKQVQAKYDELFKECHIFWAFGDKQWEEGKAKHPVIEGHKYVSIGSGGYFPGQYKQQYIEMMDAIKAWEKQAKKEMRETREETEKSILYELNNHEAFYTGDYSEVVALFEGVYTAKQIKQVYSKYQGTEAVAA